MGLCLQIGDGKRLSTEELMGCAAGSARNARSKEHSRDLSSTIVSTKHGVSNQVRVEAGPSMSKSCKR